MKLLHLPTNTASQSSVTVRALRDIGINARGLVTNIAPIQNARDVEILPGITESQSSTLRTGSRRLEAIIVRFQQGATGNDYHRTAFTVAVGEVYRTTELP